MSNLGQILRSKREERGITLKDAETALSIRVKYLEALEAGDYAIIPGEVYVKGFLRNYANYLGLNAEEMVQLYKDGQLPSATPETRIVEEQNPVPEAKPEKGSRFAFGLGLAVVLLLAAGAAFYVYPSLIQKEPPETANIPPINTAPAPQTPAAPMTPPANEMAKPVPQGITLAVKATENCWARVLTDGTEVFEGILKRGDTQTWKANKKMEITLGNAGGVEITYNNQPQAPLGESGDVVNKVYTVQ